MEGKRIERRSQRAEQGGSHAGEVRCAVKTRVSDDLHFDQAASWRPVGCGWPHCSLVTTHGPWHGLACRTSSEPNSPKERGDVEHRFLVSFHTMHLVGGTDIYGS